MNKSAPKHQPIWDGMVTHCATRRGQEHAIKALMPMVAVKSRDGRKLARIRSVFYDLDVELSDRQQWELERMYRWVINKQEVVRPGYERKDR